jgi:hypothetical protein
MTTRTIENVLSSLRADASSLRIHGYEHAAAVDALLIISGVIVIDAVARQQTGETPRRSANRRAG